MSADVGDPPVMAPPDDLWSPAHDELRRKVRAWLAEHVLPEVEAWEARAAMPREVFPAAAQAGLFGWKVPVERGGLGVDLLADAVVSEELAGCWSGGVAAALGAHKDLGPYYVWRFGTDEQRDRWMPGFLAGTSIGALAVTEPGAGSDVAGLRTVAMRDGEDYVLRGEKTFITNGHWADVVVVAALTDPDRGGHQGLSLFVVERDDPGFSSARIDTLGWRTSSTGALSFVDVRLPSDRLLGGEAMRDRGFVAIMQNFQWERIGMALGAVRAAEDVLAAFPGAPADTLTDETAAAAALTRHALRGYVSGQDMVRETSMAKWYACEVAVRVCQAALAAGGAGELRRGRLERALRDARLGPIGGGTTQIMLEVVGRTYGL